MKAVASIRRELIVALALLLVAALSLAGVAVLLLLPKFTHSLGSIILFVAVLLAVDIALFVLIGDYLLKQTIVRPMSAIVGGAEAIARDDYTRPIRVAGAQEFERLASSVNEIAEKLSQNEKRHSDNIRSLNDVNRELTEARDELVRAEKLASAGQLAAGIAHEIGNPLGVVLGYLELAERRAITQDMVDDMRREAKRIDRIVKGLLDYARPRQPAPRTIEVNDVVSGALELVEAQGHFKEIELVLELGEDVPAVRADAHQLEQIMVNLLLNATQAVDGSEESRIEVSTQVVPYEATLPPSRRQDDPSGIDYSHLRRLQARREGLTPPPMTKGTKVVTIAVQDNGPGIPAEIMDRVFDPFFSTKETGQGTGLGLAVSARLIEGMAGTIRVDSPKSGGTCFSVYLPAAARIEED